MNFKDQMEPLDKDIFFSILIPAYNEKGSIENTINEITDYFTGKRVDDYEILVINDMSTDGTEEILKKLSEQHQCVRYVNNEAPHGFGYAIIKGMQSFKGLSVCLVMADLSDAPEDIYQYYSVLKDGHECVFGSRFIKGAKIHDYPMFKLILNRIGNFFIRILFGFSYNDTTNAFKAYRREVIEGIQPFISCHFNLTVELPLKSISRGYHYKVVPISWTNRNAGKSKFIIDEMGSRYLFIILYTWLEKKLAKGDYSRRLSVNPGPGSKGKKKVA